jgi:hypothetical protein
MLSPGQEKNRPKSAFSRIIARGDFPEMIRAIWTSVGHTLPQLIA